MFQQDEYFKNFLSISISMPIIHNKMNGKLNAQTPSGEKNYCHVCKGFLVSLTTIHWVNY